MSLSFISLFKKCPIHVDFSLQRYPPGNQEALSLSHGHSSSSPFVASHACIFVFVISFYQIYNNESCIVY